MNLVLGRFELDLQFIDVSFQRKNL